MERTEEPPEKDEASNSRPPPRVGKGPDSLSSLKPLLGPSLTGKEAARALDHRPKDKKHADKYLCWDHMTHRGCPKPSSCPHSHAGVPRWESLDWSVQLQLLRRGGLKSGAQLSERQVQEKMEALRKTQAAKQAEMVDEGKKSRKVGRAEPSDN